MKKALAGVLVTALVGLMAVAATAQVPNIQLYFNGNPTYNTYSDTQADCRAPGTNQTMYVVLNNWNMFVQAVDFSIDYPAALFHMSESVPGAAAVPPTALVIGSTPSMGGTNGIVIAWTNPMNGFAPLLAVTVSAVWTAACDCNLGPQAVVVRGWYYATVGNGGKAHPTAVRWPDLVELPGVGMTSLVCPGTISTEESTWGGIKALYR